MNNSTKTTKSNEIISFGDFFQLFTVSIENNKYNLHTSREDEESTDEEYTKDEIIDFLWAHSFCPTKDEILNLHEHGLLLPILEKMKKEEEI